MLGSFAKRLVDARQVLKNRLYAEFGSLLRTGLDADRQARAFNLFVQVGELEIHDGPGATVRLLAGLPKPFADQFRQALYRELESRALSRRQNRRRSPVDGT
jgi:hypothetical protein